MKKGSLIRITFIRILLHPRANTKKISKSLLVPYSILYGTSERPVLRYAVFF